MAVIQILFGYFACLVLLVACMPNMDVDRKDRSINENEEDLQTAETYGFGNYYYPYMYSGVYVPYRRFYSNLNLPMTYNYGYYGYPYTYWY